MRTLSSVLIISFILSAGLSYAERKTFSVGPTESEMYRKDVMLHGAVELSKISGSRGETFEIQDDHKDHAMYAIYSWERRDRPCAVMIRTENINDSSDDTGGGVRDLCGGGRQGNKLSVEYSDVGLNEDRIFVSGVRVCMNKKGNKVKGLELRGKKITDDGKLVALIPEIVAEVGGFADPRIHSLGDVTQPFDKRSNCHKDKWKWWAICPRHTQIATGAILHFEEEAKQPWSLTGIELQCRHVGLVYIPQSER